MHTRTHTARRQRERERQHKLWGGKGVGGGENLEGKYRSWEIKDKFGGKGIRVLTKNKQVPASAYELACLL